VRSQIDYNVMGYSTVAVQLTTQDGAVWPGGAVLTVEASQDGATYAALTTPITYAALGNRAEIDVEGITYIRLRISTTGGTAIIVPIVIGVRTVR